MAVLPAGDRPSWTAARLARPAADLARSVRFYRARAGQTYLDPDGYRLVVAAADPGDRMIPSAERYYRRG